MEEDIDNYIDYKIGDWVETCHFMPGIVQVIDKEEDNVEVYYPHYKEKYPEYTGGSCCSIMHCGVHKIDADLAEAFFKVGEERVKRVYEFLQRNVHIKSLCDSIKWWKENKEKAKNYHPFYDEKYYDKIIEDYQEKLDDAWGIFDKIYHQTIKDLANGVINDTTKGICL
ncbi:MAG: hypothetical protein K2M17_05545 [Bacilli bacterium]|nr:hypothetical protein [Bacilli bacterium]